VQEEGLEMGDPSAGRSNNARKAERRSRSESEDIGKLVESRVGWGYSNGMEGLRAGIR
jgi:hypothetical protein